MKRFINAMLLLTMALCFILPAYAVEEDKEVTSDNGMYSLVVKYDSSYGAGNGYYTIKDKRGNLLNTFKTTVAPANFGISNDGNYIVALGGKWQHDPYYNKLIIYNSNGKLNKEYPLFTQIAYSFNMRFTPDGKIIVLSLSYDFKDYITHFDKKKIIARDCLVTFETSSGNVIGQIDCEDTIIRDIAVSNNAEWLLLSCVDKITDKYYIKLLDNKGKKYWESKSRKFGEGSPYSIVNIAPDGQTFEIKCRYKDKSVKTYTYSNNNGKIKLAKVVKSGNKE